MVGTYIPIRMRINYPNIKKRHSRNQISQKMDMGPKITLDEGLDLREVQTKGTVLRINEVYDAADDLEPGQVDTNTVTLDTLGKPVTNFKELSKKMTDIHPSGFVKKLILEEGGGMPIGDDCTVYVTFSAYWENENEPFDVKSMTKPLEVNLLDNGVLPGLEMAIKTMLVGELSIFLFSHEVMYGELGIPPRIKAAAECVFYIKLIRSMLTPKQGKLNLSEPNMFERVHKEVKLLYSSGTVLFKSKNLPLAANLFRKAVAMLHKCRLADENEEKVQEKLLKKLYMNLAICYNKLKLPLKACTACNELHRLDNLWNNGKALYINAKALRMIGQYDSAEKRLRRAIKISPQSKETKAELELLINTRNSCNQNKLLSIQVLGPGREQISAMFKEEVDNLVKNFKNNVNLCKMALPPSLNSDEMDYVKETCIRENLFFSKIQKRFVMDFNDESVIESKVNTEDNLDHNFVMDKEDPQNSIDLQSEDLEVALDKEIFRQAELLASTPHIYSTEQ